MQILLLVAMVVLTLGAALGSAAAILNLLLKLMYRPVTVGQAAEAGQRPPRGG